MANTIQYPTFNWKATDQIRAWDLFQAKAELWLAGEEIKEEIQFTKIVLMLGDEGLSRWSKFDMGAVLQYVYVGYWLEKRRSSYVLLLYVFILSAMLYILCEHAQC